jgi:hypothetical protein
MWHPNERFYIKSHIAGSIATFVFALSVVAIGLVPSFLPGIYKIIVDDRVGIIIPYLLFIALGGSAFSIWYFLFRK